MNRWIGMGRLTKDPLFKQYDNDVKVARYTLAVDRANSKTEQKADFIQCVTYGRSAEFARDYLKQGTKVVVEGKISTGSFTNRDGERVYTTEVTVEKHEFAESKKNEGFSSINAPMDIEEELPFA